MGEYEKIYEKILRKQAKDGNERARIYLENPKVFKSQRRIGKIHTNQRGGDFLKASSRGKGVNFKPAGFCIRCGKPIPQSWVNFQEKRYGRTIGLRCRNCNFGRYKKQDIRKMDDRT